MYQYNLLGVLLDTIKAKLYQNSNNSEKHENFCKKLLTKSTAFCIINKRSNEALHWKGRKKSGWKLDWKVRYRPKENLQKSEKRVLTNVETFDNIPKVLTREHGGETKGAVLRAIGEVGTSKAERKLDRVRYSG